MIVYFEIQRMNHSLMFDKTLFLTSREGKHMRLHKNLWSDLISLEGLASGVLKM